MAEERVGRVVGVAVLSGRVWEKSKERGWC